jgi:hypothetical protein
MNKSENIGELAAALCKAQTKMKSAVKDKANPFFKSSYADLSSVWDACKAELAANGLAISQHPTTDSTGSVIVETVLIHSSGQWMSSALAMKPTKNDPQAYGSAITYARRYALAAVVGVVTDDDDGNEASDRQAPASRRETQERAVKAAVADTPKEQNAKTRLMSMLAAELGIEINASTKDVWLGELTRILGRAPKLPLSEEDAKSAIFAIEAVNTMEQNGVPVVK